MANKRVRRSDLEAAHFQRDESPSQMEMIRSQPLPAARADLQISPQLYLGKTVYVVKDPVGLNYFRLQPAEHYVLKHLDGKTSAKELSEQVARRFPDTPAEPDDVLSFYKMLQSTGLLLGEGLTHGAQIRETRNKLRRSRMWATISNFLFIKLPVMDPDRMLDWIYAHVSWLMNKWTCCLAGAFMTISAIAAVLQIEHVGVASMPLLSWQNLLIMSGVFFTVKIIHEFGHGLAAKHRGLEVHELGALFMVFIPMFYIDVSDAWMVPRRRDRLWINAGGVFIEFIFASIAVWVWLATDSGIANIIALDIMISASVTTLVFNANPLLRYDGYYFMMDWLEIPNLKTKATQFVSYLAKRYLLKMENETPPPEAAAKPIFMPIYAALSGAYRVMITFGIIVLVYHILDPYGLEAIGSVLGLIAVALMVILPAVQGVRFLWTHQAKTWRRLGLSLAIAGVVALLFAGIAMIPMEETVEHATVALAAERQPVYAPQPGRVVELFVRADMQLKAGDPIVRLEDEGLAEQVDSLELDRKLAQLEMEIARQTNHVEDITAIAARLDVIDEHLADVKKKIDDLTVRAPIDGRLYTLTRMEGLLGSYLKRGVQIGTVIGQGPRELVVVLPQVDASLVRSGQPARVRMWATAAHTYHGVVQRLGGQFIREMPHEALSSATGGEVDTVQVDRYKTRPADPSVLAKIALDAPPDAPLNDGMIGRSKIVIGQTTLGAMEWRNVKKALSLDWWL
ncbi:MAG: biotin/lipoyl-binding protein [Planctomycetes bacterium]|nr:biotin/lipoyl-binding protein [Planctomycetota bacterium]